MAVCALLRWCGGRGCACCCSCPVQHSTPAAAMSRLASDPQPSVTPLLSPTPTYPFISTKTPVTLSSPLLLHPLLSLPPCPATHRPFSSPLHKTATLSLTCELVALQEQVLQGGEPVPGIACIDVPPDAVLAEVHVHHLVASSTKAGRQLPSQLVL